MIMKRVIGVPSDGPELTDQISQHFGHCNYFVGVEITNQHAKETAFVLKNNGHSSCMEPVMNMKNRAVTDMIVGGIGGRPYMGFLQVGIKLYQGVPGTIEENISFLLEGKLKQLGAPSCAGSNH
ncbi:MAG: dinitrogenase iron-molybdenum cofactor biosynthesis protein [Candidatus Lokiarchaeota archaeon]|nr:dinitrogenase iron-molybdenum cofactor biosynthesis protein [Candidatus Lokiarchaeota archaeon]MBD3338163.1 dinitrogenase iron-molybdenum cofactor biosynthesis protein [Candidatus Lokiarchaeota archaeon]